MSDILLQPAFWLLVVIGGTVFMAALCCYIEGKIRDKREEEEKYKPLNQINYE